MRTPLGRVRHYGSAHEGTADFRRQRLTGAANVLLVIGLVAVIVATVCKPYETVVTILGSPWVVALLVLLFVSAATHMRIGMQAVIEDYIHGEGLKIVLIAANTLFAVAIATIAILAVLKPAFGA